MALPDQMNTDDAELSWKDRASAQSSAIDIVSKQSNTIVFDSFSDQRDVHRRDTKANNISKINDRARRFPTDFSIRVSGEVTAILSARSVADYRVVDARKYKATAPSVAPPPPPPPPQMMSFSSVIQSSSTGAIPAVIVQRPSPPPNHHSVSPTTTPASPQAEEDIELIASLASVATSTPVRERPSPATANQSSMLSALSSVADKLCTATGILNTSTSDERTDQLRKRCRGMLQQRRTITPFNSPSSSSSPRPSPQLNSMTAITPVNSNPFLPRILPHGMMTTNRAPVVTPSATAAADQRTPSSSSSFFFAPIPRPAEVEQTLLISAQAAQAGGRKREREGDAIVDADGHPLQSGSGSGAVDGRDGSRVIAAASGQTTSTPSFSSSFIGSADGTGSLEGGCNTASSTHASDTRGARSNHKPPRLPCAPSGTMPADAPVNSALPPIATYLFADDPLSSAADQHNYHPFYRPQHQQRISSTDLTFTSVVCPVPVAGLINLSDVQLRRSSEEIIALSVLQEWGVRK